MDEVDYTYQFTYRKMDISNYYMKEILFAGVMILLFRQVSDSYQNLFKGPFKFVVFQDNKWIFTESSGMYAFDQVTPQP